MIDECALIAVFFNVEPCFRIPLIELLKSIVVLVEVKSFIIVGEPVYISLEKS